MTSESRPYSPDNSSDAGSIAVLQARNAELERQLQQYRLELEQERAIRRHCEDASNDRLQQLQQLQAILNSAPISIFVKDVQGRYLMMNPAYEAFIGYQQADLLGKTDYDILPVEVGHRCWNSDQAALQARQAIEFEEKVPATGEEHTVLVTKFAIAGDDGSPTAICGIAMDITERKQAEAALQQKAQQERALNRLVQAIYRSRDLRTIFSTATAEITQLLSVERTTIMQYQPDRRCWVRLAVYVQGQETQDTASPGFEIPDEGNPFAARLKQLQVVRVEQTSAIPGPLNQEIAETLPLPWLLVPIAVNQSIWGNLFLHKSQTAANWQDYEVELACRIADQLAIAIQQADLYHQVQTELTERQRAEAKLQKMNNDLELIVWERTQTLEVSQATLRQQEHEFRTLVENTPDMIIRFDRDLRYRYVSPSLVASAGVPASGFIGKTVADMGYPEHLVALWIETKQRVLNTRQRQVIEFSIDLPGGLQHFQSWNVPELNPDGNPESILVVVRDITNLKQAEAALRQSEELLRIALESARMGAWRVNLLTREEIWSDQSQALFGLTPGTFDGTTDTFLSLVHPDDREMIRQTTQQAFQTGNKEVEYRVVLNNQTVRWIASKGRVFFDETGKPVQISGIDMDISDRKQAEDQLRNSLQEKEILLKEIHHRVKNNLQIISSLLRMQSRQLEDLETATLFQEAQNRVQSMALIHEQLYQSVSFSHINFGQYLRTLVQNLFRSYGVSEQQIVLTLETDELQLTLNTAIPCGLIINELVSNALKYAFPGQQPGEVKVRLQQTRSTPENLVLLTIEDSGVGIPNRVDWETTNSLGLRIVRNLITQLKGSLSLDRTQGTRFHITFFNPLQIESPDQG